FIINKWISKNILLVESSFITELFAKQSAVPAIIQNNFNDLGELSKQLAFEKNLFDHSPNSFMANRFPLAKSTNHQNQSAAFGYAEKGKSSTHYEKLTYFEQIQKKMPLQPRISRLENRSCVGFKIPHDELARMINYLILKGKTAFLNSNQPYAPTFNHDPDISRSIFTLANTREGLLCFKDISNFEDLMISPIKDNLDFILENKDFWTGSMVFLSASDEISIPFSHFPVST
ncbi:MAG: hypothetical protein VW474_07910, partial [Paracoccaceae bacterium]